MRTAIWIGLAALAVASQVSAAPFYGLAQSIDGDSLRVDGKEVRLHGIDAPEFNQTCKRSGQDWGCGEDAAEQLSKLVTGREVRCSQVGTDQHGRILARCNVGGMDINRTMVATGYAVAYRRYSSEYVSAEDSAKASKRGIWASTFQMPWQYRHEEEPVQSAEPSTGAMPEVVRPKGASRSGCRIKGNHSKKGDWIYHLPGMPYYNETIPERMFCSEADARAAGFRKSRAGN